MKKTCHLVTILGLLFSLNVAAGTLALNLRHPDRYTVKSQDTLWDISAKFLKSPWQWHRLWRDNPQVKNPNLIYPGDELILEQDLQGQPRLRLKRGRYNDDGRYEQKLHPHIRQEESAQAIKTIPTDAIAQFLGSPKVVDKQELTQAPYIVGFAGEHIVGGANDRIYVRSITQPSTLNYLIYRQGQAYLDPISNNVLGYEAVYIGAAGLQTEGDPATLMVQSSAQEIRLGDRIMVNEEIPMTLNYFPKPPNSLIQAHIISVLNGVSQIGRYNVVVINKGLHDGIQVGHLFDIYHQGQVVRDPFQMQEGEHIVKLPDEISGRLMVFRPFERVSYALVMEANQAIHILDRIQTPVEQF
ncbi:MAG: hypothetical protein RL637_181 [Pseudomonadota bacterium]|jgi:LysM repeat protein